MYPQIDRSPVLDCDFLSRQKFNTLTPCQPIVVFFTRVLTLIMCFEQTTFCSTAVLCSEFSCRLSSSYYYYCTITYNTVWPGRREPDDDPLLPFLGFSYPNLLLVFLNLLFLGTCIICFSQVLDFLWVFFILFYFSVPYFGLACDHGNSFLCLEE